MNSRIIRVCLHIGVFACLANPALAQVFFAADYSSAANPTAGWQAAYPTDARFNRTFIADGGPSGQGAYDLSQRSALGMTYYGGQYYWGWNGSIEASDPAQGSRRYYRWRMRFSADTNLNGISWTDGLPGVLQNKLLIVGDGCGNDCRFILTYLGGTHPGQVSFFRIQLDGGESLADTGPMNVGQWLDIQIELDSSTSTSSMDGSFKIWINNNDYNAPTAQRTGVQLNPINWRFLKFGGYNNDGLAVGGVHIWRHTNFQAATSFASTWYGASSGTPTPASPSGLHILSN